MKKFFAVLFSAALLFGVGASTALAAPGDHGNSCPPASKNPGGSPPGCGHAPPPAPTCPPATGPISGIVQQISDAIRGGGGGPLADVIDAINCQIIVGVLGLSGPDVGA